MVELCLEQVHQLTILKPTDAKCLSMACGLTPHLQRRHVHDKQAQDAGQAAMHVLLENATHTDDTDKAMDAA